jgi:hypothetical protein
MKQEIPYFPDIITIRIASLAYMHSLWSMK